MADRYGQDAECHEWLLTGVELAAGKLPVVNGSNGSEAGIAIATRYAINPVQLTLSQTLPPQATRTHPTRHGTAFEPYHQKIDNKIRL